MQKVIKLFIHIVFYLCIYIYNYVCVCVCLLSVFVLVSNNKVPDDSNFRAK